MSNVKTIGWDLARGASLLKPATMAQGPTKWERRQREHAVKDEIVKGVIESKMALRKNQAQLTQLDAVAAFWELRHTHHNGPETIAETALFLYATGWRVNIKPFTRKVDEHMITYHHRETGASVSSPSSLLLAQAMMELQDTERAGATTNGNPKA